MPASRVTSHLGALVMVLATGPVAGCVADNHDLGSRLVVMPDLGVPPGDAVTIDELPDVSPPEGDDGPNASWIWVTSYLDILEGVRLRVDGRYLARSRLDGRPAFVNLNAYEAAPDFGMRLDLPPGFASLELVTVDGEVLLTYDAPPRSAADDHVNRQLVVWGAPGSVHSASWTAQATDGIPTTQEHTIENQLSESISVIHCVDAVDCEVLAEVAPGATYRGSIPIPGDDRQDEVSYRVSGGPDNFVFATFAATRCQFQHVLVFNPYEYGPLWRHSERAQSCIGRAR